MLWDHVVGCSRCSCYLSKRSKRLAVPSPNFGQELAVAVGPSPPEDIDTSVAAVPGSLRHSWTGERVAKPQATLRVPSARISRSNRPGGHHKPPGRFFAGSLCSSSTPSDAEKRSRAPLSVAVRSGAGRCPSHLQQCCPGDGQPVDVGASTLGQASAASIVSTLRIRWAEVDAGP
jgi:hypothetical protein